MTQDTRKDPRAKVLTMTVRYKSATLDEFIEHHSHDVSRGGMFIKTPSPFPPGTLLKFEVKIAAEQRVMQGVGRVVWKREASESSESRPAGMGVKFIKIDDESRKVIDQLVVARGESESNFDRGADAVAAPATPAAESTKPAAVPAAAVALPTAQKPARKSTMIGLGGMEARTSAAPAAAPPKAESSAGFFPQTDPSDMPPPEDRTVMKQAKELLEDALREAGGSMEDVGTAPSAGMPLEEMATTAGTPLAKAAESKSSAASKPSTPSEAETRRPPPEIEQE
jgi:uncharacterized protein (TIGR02266 family)